MKTKLDKTFKEFYTERLKRVFEDIALYNSRRELLHQLAAVLRAAGFADNAYPTPTETGADVALFGVRDLAQLKNVFAALELFNIPADSWTSKDVPESECRVYTAKVGELGIHLHAYIATWDPNSKCKVVEVGEKLVPKKIYKLECI